MSDTAMKWRLPGADALALVGIAVGYGLWGKHWLGLVLLPSALLLPFVLREHDLVRDDERVREAWRRAGFWAFAMMVAQGFLFFALEVFTMPAVETHGQTPPIRVDGRFVVAGHLSVALALAVIALLLLRSPRGESP